MRGRQQTPLDGERNRHDLSLGRALARLDDPRLPEALQLQLRAAIVREHRRRRWRPGWPALLAVILMASLVGAALAWRCVPPRLGTMQQVEQVIMSYEAALRPEVSAGAREREVVDRAERRRLERAVARGIRRVCSRRSAAELVARGLPQTVADTAAQAVARHEPWPPPRVRLEDMQVEFLHRTWRGDLVMRVRLCRGATSKGEGGDEWRFTREGRCWVVDDIVHHGA